MELTVGDLARILTDALHDPATGQRRVSPVTEGGRFAGFSVELDNGQSFRINIEEL